MFGRIFLVASCVVSLLWLGYATYDRVNQGKEFNPEYLFGEKDGDLLIVLDPNKKDAIIEVFSLQNETIKSVVNEINSSLVDEIYVSKNRKQLLIKTIETINTKNLNTIFSKNPTLKGGNQFLINDLKGKFKRNFIYLSGSNFEVNKEPWKIHFDKNSDASILHFKKNNPSVTDVYIKESGVIEYKSALNSGVFGTKVSDKVVFASAIPSSISSYEFYETDYLRYKNPDLKNSPMNNWLKYGLVHIKDNGEEAVVTDYIEGQEPIQVLYDFYKQESSNAEMDFFKNVSISKMLPTPNGFYVYQFDDYVVVSGSQTLCEKVVSNYKLGNTLSQNQEKQDEVFKGLPQKVNYRLVNKTEKVAISVYDETLLTTFFGGTEFNQVKTGKSGGSATMASFVIGSVVKDAIPIDEKNFFVTTEDKKVLFFENEKKKWEKEIGGAIVGSSSIIDIYANGKTQLLVATNKQIHVYDINGNEPIGFPIELEEETNTNSPVFYRWKGAGNFIIAGDGGKLIQYDNQGRELAIVRNQLSKIDKVPVVWVSANRPFIGVFGENKFEMIDAESRKSLRVFDASNTELMLKIPNELKLFGLKNNQLIAYNQKGSITYYEKFLNGKMISDVIDQNTIIVRDQNKLKLFNAHGISWATISLPFNDLTDVQVYTTIEGKTIIAGIDGLENKLYLWNSNGILISKNPIDGSKIVRYSNGFLFTVIDNLIVRYSI